MGHEESFKNFPSPHSTRMKPNSSFQALQEFWSSCSLAKMGFIPMDSQDAGCRVTCAGDFDALRKQRGFLGMKSHPSLSHKGISPITCCLVGYTSVKEVISRPNWLKQNPKITKQEHLPPENTVSSKVKFKLN